MVWGTFTNGDYFIDGGEISLATGRAAFGAVLTVYGAVIAICARSIYHSRFKTRLVGNRTSTGESNFWSISPITTPFEIVHLHGILPNLVSQRHFAFIAALLVCIFATILNVFSTAIANHTVVSNIALRSDPVPGRLALSTAFDGQFLVANVTSRIQALDFANAPLEELFDFAPDDSSNWVYVPEQWNNSWHGQCAYHLYPAVDLTIYPTDFPIMANLIPSLANWLPQWVTDNQTSEGSDWARVYMTLDSFPNNTGAFVDSLHLFIFHNPLDDPTRQTASSINISIVNALAHHIGRDSDGHYVQTSFKSDVHVAECTFNNANPTETYRAAGNAASIPVAETMVDVVRFRVFDAAIADQQVIQPTAQQMLRYWQAYMSVKDTLIEYPGQRRLTVAREVVQVRLSVLLMIVVSFVSTFTTALFLQWREPRDSQGRRVYLPSSTLDWIIEAARQVHHKDDPSPITPSTDFLTEHKDFEFAVSLAHDGRLTAHIESPHKRGKSLLPVEYDQLYKMESIAASHRQFCGNCHVAEWSSDLIESPDKQKEPLTPVEYDQQSVVTNMVESHRLICGNCHVARWSVDHIES